MGGWRVHEGRGPSRVCPETETVEGDGPRGADGQELKNSSTNELRELASAIANEAIASPKSGGNC